MLTSTYVHPCASEYRAPGGPWAHGSLDELLTSAARFTARPLLVDGDMRLGGHELTTRVAAAAGALRSLGVGAGDVVTWQLPNSWLTVVLLRACWRIGAVAAPLHHLAGGAEIDGALRTLRPAIVLAADDTALRAAASDERFTIEGDWHGMLDAAPVHEPWRDPDAIAAVLFTSGSSGAPKAVIHSQASLAYKARLMGRVHGLDAGDTVLMPAPCAHISGLLNGVTLPGASAMTTVLMCKWDATAALSLIERERVTFMIGPPTFFVALMQAPGFRTERVASLRLVSSGGAGVTSGFCDDASARLDARVKRTYGSTEAPTIATGLPNDDERAVREHDGRAIGAVELTIRDPETGAPQPAGAPGELWVQGPELCSGYVDPAHTAAAFTPDGWFRTGDLATIDADGWLTVVGRLTDVVIRGGENISTAEVERVLDAHPSVRQSVAVGYPDALMGERVCAFVVSDTAFTLDDCATWFAHQGVARFRTPEQVVRVDALPLLATGKPDRAALRDIATTRFGADPSAS